MGQKVNPHGLRVGVIKDWDSNWYAEDNFSDFLVEDYKIREFVKKKLYSAGISKIEIERPTDKVRVIIHTAKPGFVIGKGGAEIENLKKELVKVLDRKVALDIKIMDVKNPDKHAQLVAENIAQQLENRISFSARMSKRSSGGTRMPSALRVHCSGLNLLAPCDVPIEIASESTPVFVTKSITSSGLV